MATTTTFEDHAKGGKSATLACGAGETSAALLCPGGDIGFTMVAASGTSKVQYTRSGEAAILGNTANWVDFAAATGTTTPGTLTAVSAIRLVNVTGTSVCEVRFP